MKMEIKLEAVPLARPRINTATKGRYLPARSQDFREQFQWLLLNEDQIAAPYKKPLKVELHFYKPVKTTVQKYGDIDNLAKAVLDACNGILWLDDSQIIELHCYKHKGEGKIEMEVMECT